MPEHEVCTMCGRTATGPTMAAPGPMVHWPQLDAWICGDRDCRRHAQFEVDLIVSRYEARRAKLARVPVSGQEGGS